MPVILVVVLLTLFPGMTYNNTQTGETIQTGDLVTINSLNENNEVYWHIANLSSEGNLMYYPYAFIGIRTICSG